MQTCAARCLAATARQVAGSSCLSPAYRARLVSPGQDGEPLSLQPRVPRVLHHSGRQLPRLHKKEVRHIRLASALGVVL